MTDGRATPGASTPPPDLAAPAHAARWAALQELCPGGSLRFGVVFAPEPTSFFVGVDDAGRPYGVTVELATRFARALEVPVDFLVVPNSGELVKRLGDASIDAAFMPVDAERRAQVDFGPAYTTAENTYLVRAGAAIRRLADVDRSGVRLIGIAGTTTLRSAAGMLQNTAIEPVESVGDAIDRLRLGAADALALTRDAIAQLLPLLPGATVLDETFRQVQIAVAVPKARLAALAWVTQWLDLAKSEGLVRRVLDDAGLHDIPVAA